MTDNLLCKIWPVKKYYEKNKELAEENQKVSDDLEIMKLNYQRINTEQADNKNTINNLQAKVDCLSEKLEVQIKVAEEKAEKNSELENQITYLENSLSFYMHPENETIKSKEFWEEIYKNGKTSGTGSYGKIAEFKAEILNQFVNKKEINTIIELGCGDGNQLSYMKYPQYTGIDVSETVISRLRESFGEDINKRFYTTDEREKYINQTFELSLSLDVIFHLLEEDVYEKYMTDLFNLSTRYVIVYSSNHDAYTPWPEYRHRNFFRYIQENFSENWRLEEFIPNKYPYKIGCETTTSASDFYIFKKQTEGKNHF